METAPFYASSPRAGAVDENPSATALPCQFPFQGSLMGWLPKG